MGMPVQEELKIAELLESNPSPQLANGLQLEYNTTLRLLHKQQELTGLELQSVRDGYFPTLSAFASYNWQGQSSQLFSKDNAINTFSTGMWGLSLNVPIFDGFQKRNKIQQIHVQQQQLGLNFRQASNLTQMEFHNATEQLRQSQTLISQQEENMKLAEELYGITALSYQEGVAPLTELLNAETSLKEAQTQYLTATLQKKLAELDHLKTSGELARLIETAGK